MSALDEHVAGFVVELGRERTRADAGDVRLGHTDDPIDVARADAGTGARTAGDGVRRRHERIRAVIEIEKGRLGAFEQDVLIDLERIVHEPNGVADVGLEPWRDLVEVLADDGVALDRELVVDLGRGRCSSL